jgi:HlyD family secretion protein
MSTEATSVSTADVQRTLGGDSVGGPAEPPFWRKHLKWLVLGLIVLIAAYFFFGRSTAGKVTYTTQDITRGPITVTVTATGNLEPRNQVDIGSELSGTMRTVNVDVNDVVKANQVLAILDTTRIKAQVLQQESSLQSAEARVMQAVASSKESRANYQRLVKVRELSGGKLPSQQDMDVAESAVARAEGDEAAAKASVAQSRAQLEGVRTDLSKTEIRSPINGIVLVRSVEPGSTVAASLQAPILFTLAEDLKKMELHVSVDEADVGSVQVGQKATFSVDAFSSRRFQATITQVHFASNNTGKSSNTSGAASATSTGVVTYETVLEVDNSDLLLRPGMTATAEIVTTNIEDAVLIPNAALRFTPPGQQVPGVPGAGGAAGGGANQQRGPLSALMPQMGGRPPFGRGGNGQQGGTNASRRMGRAWVLENGKPEMAMFRPGATDGRMTQVLPLQQQPNFARLGNADPALEERMKKAFERKLEPGTHVITDAETSK